MRYLVIFFPSSRKKIHWSPLRWSLNVLSIASTAKVRAKCILLSFLLFLCSGVFMVAIFMSFLFSFCNHFTAKQWKWSKNEAENDPKMAWKWLPWTTLLEFWTIIGYGPRAIPLIQDFFFIFFETILTPTEQSWPQPNNPDPNRNLIPKLFETNLTQTETWYNNVATSELRFTNRGKVWWLKLGWMERINRLCSKVSWSDGIPWRTYTQTSNTTFLCWPRRYTYTHHTNSLLGIKETQPRRMGTM